MALCGQAIGQNVHIKFLILAPNRRLVGLMLFGERQWMSDKDRAFASTPRFGWL